MKKGIRVIEATKFGGYMLELDGNTIVGIAQSRALYNHNKIVRLNDQVVANGRIFVPKDTKGKVMEIIWPYTEGCSSDIILVDFYDGKGPYNIKFKDLVI